MDAVTKRGSWTISVRQVPIVVFRFAYRRTSYSFQNYGKQKYTHIHFVLLPLSCKYTYTRTSLYVHLASCVLFMYIDEF